MEVLGIVVFGSMVQIERLAVGCSSWASVSWVRGKAVRTWVLTVVIWGPVAVLVLVLWAFPFIFL